MRNRRRIIMDRWGLNENGLLFWFDGFNNVTGGGVNSDTKAKWYPYMVDQSLSSMYIEPLVNAYHSSSGYVLPFNNSYKDGGLKSNVAPFSVVGSNDYTMIVVMSNVNFGYSSIGNDGYPIWACNPVATSTSQTSRQFHLGWSRSPGVLSTFARGDESIYETSITYPSTANVIITAYERCNNNDKLFYYQDGNLQKVENMTTMPTYTDSGCVFWLGCYDYIPMYNAQNSPSTTIASAGTNWAEIPATYHACILYNRALSDKEVARMISFLTKRYGL